MPRFIEDLLYGATVIAVVVTCIAAICVGVGLAVKVVQEKGCNDSVASLNSPKIVDGDYKFWAGECFLTLDDGKVIPYRRHITVEQQEVY